MPSLEHCLSFLLPSHILDYANSHQFLTPEGCAGWHCVGSSIESTNALPAILFRWSQSPLKRTTLENKESNRLSALTD